MLPRKETGKMDNNELRIALKRYRRKKSIREAVFIVLYIASLGVPIWMDFSRTEWIVWGVGILCVVRFEELRRHIRAMQIRLAQMADMLDQVVGNEPQDHTLLELGEA
jgi:hypothetical protein